MVTSRKREMVIPRIPHLQTLALILLASYPLGSGAQNVNRAPHLDSGGDMSRFALREDTPVGSAVYTLRGSDPEGSRLRYSISGPHLTVDPASGVVSLIRPLDREEEDILEVVVSVTDEPVGTSEANTVSVRREVAILDTNDNPPIFHNRPYSLAIPETTPVGKIVTLPGAISITDADGGLNADVVLSCNSDNRDTEGCETFEVWAEKVLEGQFTGVLKLKAPLDFERRRGYSLSIRATDAATNPNDRLNSSSRVAIEILDVQDQPPMFLDEPYSASVAEGSPEGTSVLTMRARDGDYGNPRQVQLSLSNDLKGYFRLEPVPQSEDSENADGYTATAILVTSNTLLDREDPDIVQSGGIYTFQVVATEMDDGSPSDAYTVSAVTIVVRDVDDQLPTFSAPSYRVLLSEDASRDSPLPSLPLIAADSDASAENARFVLRLLNVPGGGDSSSIFSVHPSGPVSGRTPVVVRISEPSGLDYDSPEARREFAFDVEAIPLVNGSDIPAIEVSTNKSRIYVNLMDANDNAPQFSTDSMRLRVKEDAPPSTMISGISATDADSGNFGRIKYSLGGFGSERFWTDPEKGGLFVGECGGRGVSSSTSSIPVCFDFESQMWYSLTLSAEDGGGRVSTVNLLVELEDVNDNAPVFEKKEYRRTVREGATSFDPQLFVKANDRDGPSQGGGEVKYEILGGSVGPLEVDLDTGEVRLNRPALSSETPGSRGEFEAIIRATDKGTPPMYTDARLFVRVGVPGNQRPLFKGVTVDHESAILRATVKENASPGTHVIKLSASDPDGPDAQLSYAIAGGARDNFVVDAASGEVTVASEANLRLERQEHGGVAGLPEYGVIVIAIDSGSPARETGTATLVVTVEDVNDRPPRFPPASASESYVRQVSERTAPGTLLMHLHAEDPDSDALLKYSLLPLNSATDHAGLPSVSSKAFDLDTAFKINSTTGDLFVAGPLSHQVAAVITLTVEAKDLNAVEQVEEQTDQVEVTIYVEAYSDDLPVFSIVSLTPGVSGSTLVSEQRNQQLKEAGDTNRNSTTATILVSVPEEREVGSLLLQIGAYDPILGQPVNQLEKDINSDPDNYVSISSPSGHIKLNRPIDYETLEEKIIKVRVKAIADDSSRSSEALIIINVEDINDNNPEFSQEVYKAHIPESARYPEQVVTVTAMDKDSVSTWGTVTYSASGDGANLFTVDANTGVVRVAKGAILDHETKPQVDLLVTATDSGQKNSQSVRGLQRKSTAIVTIEILDVNDNPPQFIGGTHPLMEVLSQNDPLLRLKNGDEEVVLFSAVVPENVPVGFVVASLRATDPDEGPGGIVNYDIVNEGEAQGLFQINKSSGDVKTVKALTGKGRTEPYALIVRASDRGASPLSSDAVLSVLVGDVASNDGVPHFNRPTQSEVARIPENSPIGSPVFKVRATDPDDPSTPNGRIYYKFLDDGKSGSDTMTFLINRDTGLITTRQLLDREKKDRYTLILEASDGGKPPQQASQVLDVIVEDVDDHKPIFKRSLNEEPLVMHLREEVEEGTVVGSVAAVDEDIGNNAKIDYRIIYGNEQGLFKISRSGNNQGIISTMGRIDREEMSIHNLVIKCFPASESLEYPHKPYDHQNPSEIQVKVIVDDIDDNSPEFTKGNITVGVRLNVPVDTPVVRLEANDIDAESGPIYFNLTSATFSTLSGMASPYNIDGVSSNSAPIDVFRLGLEDGELRTAQSLVPYADGVFTLLLTATSISPTPMSNEPVDTNSTISNMQRQANATLKVFVLRERDLLKFVFSKPPSEVRQNLPKFQQAVEQALLLPSVSLNVYDAQFHSKGDGSLDFGSTSSCFQLVGKESYDLAEMESLLHDHGNTELEKVYSEYGVQDVQRCAPIIARAETSWVQAWVLAIACFIGVASVIAACVLCCPQVGFKKKHHRFGKGGMMPPPAPPPSILVSTVGLEPDAEWIPGMGPPSTILHDRHDQFSPYGYHARR